MGKNLRRYQGGFTLIELIIAIGILALIVGVAYGSLTQIISSKQVLDDDRDTAAITNAVLSRMVRELQLAVGGTGLLPPRDKLSSRPSSRINLLGESDALPSGEPGDSITFLALEGGQYLPDGGTHSGMVQITYRVAADPEQKGPQKEPVYLLIREETPLIRPFKKAYEKSMIFPITNRLVSLQFRYLSKEDSNWSATWGNENNKTGLPAMVKLIVKVRSPLGKVSELSTAVPFKSL